MKSLKDIDVGDVIWFVFVAISIIGAALMTATTIGLASMGARGMWEGWLSVPMAIVTIGVVGIFLTKDVRCIFLRRDPEGS